MLQGERRGGATSLIKRFARPHPVDLQDFSGSAERYLTGHTRNHIEIMTTGSLINGAERFHHPQTLACRYESRKACQTPSFAVVSSGLPLLEWPQ